MILGGHEHHPDRTARTRSSPPAKSAAPASPAPPASTPISLRKLGSPDWNPTADTLARLEKLIQRGTTEVLVGAEAIIDEARNGRMFILVDDDDRENEGDLVIPAQMATPDAINFMARHGRGLICLALTKERADAARPGADGAHQPQPQRDRLHRLDRGARRGFRPESAPPTARAPIAVAIDAANGPDALVSPGHVFPLVAQARRSAGPRRPYRGGGRRRPARRPQPERRDLRDHARGRDHGPARRSDGVRRDPRPQDRHHPRPHRLPPEEGPYGRAGRRQPASPPAAGPTGRRRCSATRRAARSSWRWSTAPSTPTSRCWCGCTASTCSPTCSAKPARARACCTARWR